MPSATAFLDEPQAPSASAFLDEAPVAETGEQDGFLAKINRALGTQGYQEPSLVSGKELTQTGIEGEQALPIFVRHALERASHAVPTSWSELGGFAESFVPPIEAYRQAKQGYDIATGTPPEQAVPGIDELRHLEDIKTQFGGDSPEYKAASGDVAGDILPQMIMAGMLGKGLKVPEPSHILPGGPKPMPDLPPSPTLGPTTIAGDVSRALERRFTLEPEPQPEIAPAPSIEETLARTEPPPVEPPPTTADITRQILKERSEKLARAAVLRPLVENARKLIPRGEPALEAELAEIDAWLKNPNLNPVVHAPPETGTLPGLRQEAAARVGGPEKVQHGEFKQKGYTALPTEEAPAPVAAPEAAAPAIPPEDVRYAGGEPPALEVQPETPAPVQKPSKIGLSIEAKAVEAKLTEGFAETAGYDPITIADQAQRATSFVKNSPTDARAVIRGEASLPQGLRGTSLITAMEEELLRKPDAQLAYELANSPLTSATSAAAQEMRLMSERVPDSIAAKFQEIREARRAGSKKRGETPERMFQEVKTEIVRQASKRPTWEAFVREITCA